MDRQLRWLILAIWALPAAVRCENIENNVGFGLELILAKLESLEYEMMSLKEQNRNLTTLLTEVLRTSTKLCPPEAVQTATVKDDQSDAEVYSSCSNAPRGESGKFMIQPVKGMKPFQANCEMQYEEGGWTMIQHRFNGSESFYRTWAEYKNGFGGLDGEFWFGLDRIHLLTSLQRHEIVFVLTDFDGVVRYAKYSRFAIGSEIEGYYIKELGSYTGTAGDAFNYHKNMKFSTFDADNDKYSENCAKNYHGAWWYRSCFQSNLNGKYINARNDQAMCWNTFKKGNDGLMSSIIMIREV